MALIGNAPRLNIPTQNFPAGVYGAAPQPNAESEKFDAQILKERADIESGYHAATLLADNSGTVAPRLSGWMSDSRAPGGVWEAIRAVNLEERRVENLGVGPGTIVPRDILTSFKRAIFAGQDQPDSAATNFVAAMDRIGESIAGGGFNSIGDHVLPASYTPRYATLQPLSRVDLEQVQVAAF